MDRLELYLYKSATATIGQEAEKAPGIGDAVKGFGKNVALTAATMFAPALAGKGWNAVKGMAATKITEIGNQLPELGKQLSNNPGVGNFMKDLGAAYNNVFKAAPKPVAGGISMSSAHQRVPGFGARPISQGAQVAPKNLNIKSVVLQGNQPKPLPPRKPRNMNKAGSLLDLYYGRSLYGT